MSMTNNPAETAVGELNNPYGYVPTLYVCIVFIALFTITSVIHTAQAVVRKQWFLLFTVILCGFLEVGGWGARLWSHYEPFNDIPFQIQIVLTIVAPTPLLAANFVIFGRIIRKLGSVYSRLTPRLYTIIFCLCDIVSLCVQGGGGGVAATADDRDGARMGGNIMLGGIAFQIVVIITFSALAIEYYFRYITERPIDKINPSHKDYSTRGNLTRETNFMLLALTFNTLVLFTRAIYRLIELSDGWNGTIITTEIYFNVLDGAMVVLAIYTYNFVHPGWLLAEGPASRDAEGYVATRSGSPNSSTVGLDKPERIPLSGWRR